MIENNIFRLKQRIENVCKNIAIDPSNITIVAVSKNRTPEEIKQVIKAGIFNIGENRVQEAVSKYKVLKEIPQIKWHMVGHLQTNKAKEAVRTFDLIQSVDSLHLAEKINKCAEKIKKVQEVLIEVKTSPEPTKFGIRPDKLLELLKEMANFKNLKIKGLMTIAPYFAHPQDTRPFFRILRELKEKVNQQNEIPLKLEILSMGMSDDFEIAIEEGSNMLRIGRAIFEG
jgi:pyridoxal phosphate enzyme (YggS family)